MKRTLLRSIVAGFAAVAVIAAGASPAAADPSAKTYPVDRTAGYVVFDDYGEHFLMYDTKTNGRYIWITWGTPDISRIDYHDVRNNTYYRDLDLDLPEGLYIEWVVCEGSATEVYFDTCDGWYGDYT